ncbi:MAG: DapH/DapD/GlmU-related protein [Clostridium sp.]|uniref:N-acetyltransferase n=1 Tax=Clostridium sp. TaxID=1506 RepID=UPI002FCB3C95
MKCISESAKLGSNLSIGNFVVIEDDVVIGDNCIIGHNVVIHKGTAVGNNVRIDDNTVVGKEPMRAVNSIFKSDKTYSPCIISDGCLIGATTVIYVGSQIGEKTLIADMAVVREDTTIGEKTIIGKGATIENFCKIGSNVKIQTNVYITAYSDVEDYAFIAPCVVTSNDNYAARDKERFNHFRGVTVKRGGRIGAGAIILPDKTIHEEGLVAAGSVVTRDVEREMIVLGSPAKNFKKVPKEQLLENQ